MTTAPDRRAVHSAFTPRRAATDAARFEWRARARAGAHAAHGGRALLARGEWTFLAGAVAGAAFAALAARGLDALRTHPPHQAGDTSHVVHP
ncbi:MAG: hypothetical protein IBJ10_01170 [Phycisphaerales bacterium]|nr:hypothetical protein [Phycisphaerales bacterium]